MLVDEATNIEGSNQPSKGPLRIAPDPNTSHTRAWESAN
jgi:hypothetical protein